MGTNDALDMLDVDTDTRMPYMAASCCRPRGQTDFDEVAEWLRRWTANALCPACVGSNAILATGRFEGMHDIPRV